VEPSPILTDDILLYARARAVVSAAETMSRAVLRRREKLVRPIVATGLPR